MDRRRLRVVILPTGTMTRVSLRTPPPLPRYHADVIIPFDQVCSVTCATSDRGFCPHVGAWCRSMGFTSGSGATNLTMLRFATRFPRSCARTLRFGREARVPPLLASVVPRFVLILFSVPGSTQLPPVAEGHDPPMLFLAGLFDVHKSADYHGGPLHTFTVVTTGTDRVGGWCSSAWHCARFFCPPFYRHHIPYTPHLPALAWHEGEESNQALSWLHDRMPVILDAEGVGRWLDAALPFDVVAPLLRPYAGDLVWKRVTTAVNQLKNEVAKDRVLWLTFRRGSLPLCW